LIRAVAARRLTAGTGLRVARIEGTHAHLQRAIGRRANNVLGNY